MEKSFKDFVNDAPVRKKRGMGSVSVLAEVSKPEVAPSADIDVDGMRQSLREELMVSMTSEIEMAVRQENAIILEQLKTEIKKEIFESYMAGIDANNSKLLDAIVLLSERIDMLSSNLNIDIPTPIITVQVPDRKVTKKVNRDARGNIVSITEESEE